MEKSIIIILLVLYGVVMLLMCYIDIFKKKKKPKNKVHFYVARDKDGTLWLYLGKPHRHYNIFCTDLNSSFILTCHSFYRLGLNKDDYANLKWEDEPVEVFINMED